MWVQNKFWVKEKFGEKLLVVKKTFGFQTNVWTEKNFGSEKQLFGLVRLG